MADVRSLSASPWGDDLRRTIAARRLGLGIGPSFGTEFAKMRKLAPRLRAAGLDVDRL